MRPSPAPVSARARLIRWLAGALAAILSLAAPAHACEVPQAASVSVGSFSPAAIKAGAVPYVATGAGFSCATLNILTLLSANYLSATISAGTVLKLTSTSDPANSISYQVFANASSAYELKPGIPTYYMNGAVLNLLNLGGDQGLNVQMFVKFPAGVTVAPGTYTGVVPIKWAWNFCNGIAALGLCVGYTDAGTSTVAVTVTLIVEPRNPTVSVSHGPMIWDPVNGTSNPKAIPGGKRRLILTISNPDIVATDAGAVSVVLPTADRMAIALEGDGSGNGTAVQVTQGNVPSGTTVTYVSPTSTTDQIDFSNDRGASWGFAPAAGDPISQAAVTAIRVKPLGTMAPSSSLSVSIPYTLK